MGSPYCMLEKNQIWSIGVQNQSSGAKFIQWWKHPNQNINLNKHIQVEAAGIQQQETNLEKTKPLDRHLSPVSIWRKPVSILMALKWRCLAFASTFLYTVVWSAFLEHDPTITAYRAWQPKMCTLIRNLSNGQNVVCRDTGVATCVGDPLVILQISPPTTWIDWLSRLFTACFPTKWWTPDFWTTISNSSSFNMEGKLFSKNFPSHWFFWGRDTRRQLRYDMKRKHGDAGSQDTCWTTKSYGLISWGLRRSLFLISWICLSWVDFEWRSPPPLSGSQSCP